MTEEFFQPSVVVPMITMITGFATLWVKSHYESQAVRLKLEIELENARHARDAHAAEVHEQVVNLQNVGNQLAATQKEILDRPRA